MPTGYRNYLTLKHELKTIPYGGTGEIREDGDANYGFKDIKSDNSQIEMIPELQSDAALKSMVKEINNPQTGIFSIGCVSDRYEDKNRFRYAGYIEFSFNSAKHITDPANYFPLFSGFEQLLHKKKFLVKVEFNWSLQPATFIDKGIAGYTCSIYLNTYFVETKLAAEKAWQETLKVLGGYLSSVPIDHNDYIFG